MAAKINQIAFSKVNIYGIAGAFLTFWARAAGNDRTDRSATSDCVFARRQYRRW